MPYQPVTFNQFRAKSITPKKGAEQLGYQGEQLWNFQPINPRDNYLVTSGAETEKFSEILQNPVVRTALDARTNGVFWVPLSVEGRNDYTRYPQAQALDEQIIPFVEWVFDNQVYASLRDELKGLYEMGRDRGFVVAELVFAQENGWTYPESIKAKYSPDFEFYIDSYGNLNGFDYRGGTRIEYEELQKYIIGVYPNLVDGNYYGQSLLQAIYHDVKLLELLEEFQTRGMKYLSIRPIIHYYESTERSETRIANIRELLFAMEAGSVLSLPMDNPPKEGGGANIYFDEIKVLEDRASPKGLELMTRMIDFIQQRINRRLGVPDDLGLSPTETTGSYAKAGVEFQMSMAPLLQDQEWIESVINRQIIPAILRYNFSAFPRWYRLPAARFSPIEEDVQATQIQVYAEAIKAGIIQASEPFVREALGFPMPETPTEPEQPALTPQPSLPNA